MPQLTRPQLIVVVVAAVLLLVLFLFPPTHGYNPYVLPHGFILSPTRPGIDWHRLFYFVGGVVIFGSIAFFLVSQKHWWQPPPAPPKEAVTEFPNMGLPEKAPAPKPAKLDNTAIAYSLVTIVGLIAYGFTASAFPPNTERAVIAKAIVTIACGVTGFRFAKLETDRWQSWHAEIIWISIFLADAGLGFAAVNAVPSIYR